MRKTLTPQEMVTALLRHSEIIKETPGIDAVQIIVSGNNGTHTFMTNAGHGDIHTRVNLARIFVKQEDEKMINGK